MATVHTNVSRVREVLFLAIDEVNRMQPEDQHLPKNDTVALIGPESRLSSLGLVNFVVAAEEKIDDEFHRNVPLIELVSGDGSQHFQTIGALSVFVAEMLEDHSHGE